MGRSSSRRGITRLSLEIAAHQKERYESAVLAIRDLMPPASRTPVLSFAKLMVAILRLDDRQLDLVGKAWESAGGYEWLTAFSLLSSPAMKIGFTVRWVRWPNPTDEQANIEFRRSMDPAAKATESAAAALAEPDLTPQQVALLYGPLATVILPESLTVSSPF